MTADEKRSWLALVLVTGGYALGAAAEATLVPFFAGLLPVVGGVAGYGLWRLIPPRRGGPPGYWRGRANW